MLAYASVRIEEPRVGAFGERLEKLVHGAVLILRTWELRFFHPSYCYTRANRQSDTHDVAEPAPRKLSCDLRNGGCPTDRCHAACAVIPESVNDEHIQVDAKRVDPLWTTRGESGYELSPVLAVVCEARVRFGVGVPISNTGVPRTVDQRSAACA